MGTFSVEAQIRPAAASGDRWTPVKCLVETGAAFCRFSGPCWKVSGSRLTGHIPVVLADGTNRDQPAGWLEIRYGDRSAVTLVLFAGENGLPLLGAHAIEELGLVVDPMRRVLEPGRFPLA